MSIFWIGGEERVVPCDEVYTTENDVFFLPGIIHGSEHMLIQAWGYCNGERAEDERIGLNYLCASQILEWAAKATDENGNLNHEAFCEYINDEAENFVVDNDGSGDFASINEVWNLGLPWDYADVIAWAKTYEEGSR